MPTNVRRRTLLCSSDAQRLADVQNVLGAMGWAITTCDFSTSGDDFQEFSLVIIDVGESDSSLAEAFCRRVRAQLANRFVPVVMLAPRSSPQARRRSFDAGADGYVTQPIDTDEFLDVVGRLVRIKDAHDNLWEETIASRRASRRFEYSYRQIDQELELARKIQTGLLPRQLPHRPPIRFAVRYEIAGRVCGDFYDFADLGNRAIGFYVADVMGHGIPAGLLTMYLKKAVVAKEPTAGGQRILSPGEVLANVNRDLVGQQLSENPFITMEYLLLDLDSLALRYARAGHPYPLRIAADGTVSELRSDGTLLGIFETDFENRSVQLAPGEKVIVFTDGVDGVVYGSHQQGIRSFVACVQDRSELPITDLIESVYHSLFAGAGHDDDLTIIGFEIEQ